MLVTKWKLGATVLLFILVSPASWPSLIPLSFLSLLHFNMPADFSIGKLVFSGHLGVFLVTANLNSLGVQTCRIATRCICQQEILSVRKLKSVSEPMVIHRIEMHLARFSWQGKNGPASAVNLVWGLAGRLALTPESLFCSQLFSLIVENFCLDPCSEIW